MSQLFVLYCTNYNYLFLFHYQWGWVPLQKAAVDNKVEVVRVLVEASAIIDITSEVMICFILNKLQMCMINCVN